MYQEIGLFMSHSASKMSVARVVEKFSPLEVKLITRVPQTKEEVMGFPDVIASMGGDGTTRALLSGLYKLREPLSQRHPILLATVDGQGTLSKMDWRLRNSGRALTLEEIMELDGNSDGRKVPIATIDDEVILNDASIGQFEDNLWATDKILRGKIPKQLRVPFRHILGYSAALARSNREGYILDTVFTNRQIGPYQLFWEVDYFSNAMGRLIVPGGSRAAESIKLSLGLFFLQQGIRPPLSIMHFDLGTSFSIPSRKNPVALDGDRVLMPNNSRGVRTVKKNWEFPMVALAG